MVPALTVPDHYQASPSAEPSGFLSSAVTYSACGPDLAHDPAFRSLQHELTGRAEQQWGDTVVPAVEPDWHRVRTLARELSQRSRDLRLLVPLARAESRLAGVMGTVPVLEVTLDALTSQWDQVHPILDPHAEQDGVDPATARFSALLDLAARTGLAADLRAFHGELPQETQDADSEPAIRVAARAAASLLARISAALTDRAADAPLLDVQPLCAWLGSVAGELPGTSKVVPGMPLTTSIARVVDDSIHHADAAIGGDARGLSAPLNRAACGRLLDLVVDWLEQHEPAHPAPLLIRRARRLLDADFLQILRDLAPDASNSVELITGCTPGNR